MASNRRIGREDSETRNRLLRAAGQLMAEEGYAQVTSRKLAQRAGLKPQLVHYYFRTMGALFESLFRLSTARHLEQLDEVARSDEPLVRLFELSCDPAGAAMQLEFLALASHRKEMHALIAEFGGMLNEREAAIVRAALAAEGVEIPHASAEEIATIIQTAARGLAFAGKFNRERYANARATLIAWLRMAGRGELHGEKLEG